LDIVARGQVAHPFERAFTSALQHMAIDAQLTSQERRAVTMQLYGHKYENIAEKMFISLDTIRKHIQHIYRETICCGACSLVGILPIN
jgi:DNA-binding NarL/FixJ family response regulator